MRGTLVVQFMRILGSFVGLKDAREAQPKEGVAPAVDGVGKTMQLQRPQHQHQHQLQLRLQLRLRPEYQCQCRQAREKGVVKEVEGAKMTSS